MNKTLQYVYAIIPSSSSISALNKMRGIDDAPVSLISNDDAAALVTDLDGEKYAPSVIEENAGNMDWITPHAVAHDRVVTHASDSVPVVPLPMWTMFSSVDGVKDMLRARAGEFAEAFERVTDAREYSVRLYVIQSALLEKANTLSTRLSDIEVALQNASPGQRYLLQRKLENERKDEARNIARSVARETYEILEQHSTQALNDSLPKESRTDGSGSAILNGVFLVKNDSLNDFRSALTNLINKYESSGFKFEFTGPWPPYHFVNGR